MSEEAMTYEDAVKERLRESAASAAQTEAGAIVQVRKLTGELDEAKKKIAQLEQERGALVGTIRVLSKVLG